MPSYGRYTLYYFINSTTSLRGGDSLSCELVITGDDDRTSSTFFGGDGVLFGLIRA